MATGVYSITHIASGEKYIGSANNIAQRWRDHKSALEKQTRGNPVLQCSWCKYGPRSFLFEIVEECQKDELIERDQHYLRVLLPAFNIRRVANSNAGLKHTVNGGIILLLFVKWLDLVTVSKMCRAKETAALIFPGAWLAFGHKLILPIRNTFDIVLPNSAGSILLHLVQE